MVYKLHTFTMAIDWGWKRFEWVKNGLHFIFKLFNEKKKPYESIMNVMIYNEW